MAKTGNEEDIVETGPNPDIGKADAQPHKFTKEEIRAQIFQPKNTERKRLPLDYFGTKLEWRVPSVSEAQDLDSGGRNQMVMLLIEYTFLPDTDEKVFDVSDYETLANMPINPSFQAAVNMIGEQFNLGVDDKVKN